MAGCTHLVYSIGVFVHILSWHRDRRSRYVIAVFYVTPSSIHRPWSGHDSTHDDSPVSVSYTHLTLPTP